MPIIKITVVIPYAELHDQVLQIFREHSNLKDVEYRITHIYGTNVDAMQLGDSDIIISRGLTQRAIKRSYKDAMVLPLKISTYDVILAIHECRKSYGAKRILFVNSGEGNYDVGLLEEITGVRIVLKTIEDESGIIHTLSEAEKNGFDAMVGGGTACILANDRGWRTTMIRLGGETLQSSVKEAINTANVIINERVKAEISRTILQNSKEGILYFNEDGILTLYNRRVFETLNIPPKENLSGRHARELFGDPDTVRLIYEAREASGVIQKFNQVLVVSDFVPVRLENQAMGIICSFRRVNEIQDTEHRIRKSLNKKGLVAKYNFSDIIHASPKLKKTIDTAYKYAEAEANVLLIGETGTGKELFAQSIHSASARKNQPFVAVNCAAFPQNLLESELYGYTEGAFSGAAKGGKTGLFELAHGGTLFLDEVGEIPLNLQASLLRALQEGEIRRIGDNKVVPVNVRIIAATNRELRDKAEAGQLRMDLLYRLDVLSLNIPPLRERLEDIILIAKHYMNAYCAIYRKSGITLTAGAVGALEAYHWPGNTRELKNVCERLVVLCAENSAITRDLVAGMLKQDTKTLTPPQQRSSKRENAQMEGLIQFALSLGIKKNEIARMIGVSRTTLWRHMHKPEETMIRGE